MYAILIYSSHSNIVLVYIRYQNNLLYVMLIYSTLNSILLYVMHIYTIYINILVCNLDLHYQKQEFTVALFHTTCGNTVYCI